MLDCSEIQEASAGKKCPMLVDDMTRRGFIATWAGLTATPAIALPTVDKFGLRKEENLTFAEAAGFLARGEYVQRVGWGTRHLRQIRTLIKDDEIATLINGLGMNGETVARVHQTYQALNRQLPVAILFMYEGRRMTWFSYEQDKQASDWRIVAKKGVQPHGLANIV